jgi:hypothetical protein
MIVATDVSRWLMLAAFCTWLLSALVVIRQTGRIAASPRSTVTDANAFGAKLARDTRPTTTSISLPGSSSRRTSQHCVQP